MTMTTPDAALTALLAEWSAGALATAAPAPLHAEVGEELARVDFLMQGLFSASLDNLGDLLAQLQFRLDGVACMARALAANV